MIIIFNFLLILIFVWDYKFNFIGNIRLVDDIVNSSIDRIIMDGFSVREEEIFLTLSIPKLSFSKEVYCIDSVFNDVSYNVKILDYSSIDRRIFFFAAHSGNGDNCYFNDLIYLEKGDFVVVKIKNDEFCYVIEEIFLIDKDGTFEFVDMDDSLFLITCSLVYKNKQLIVRGSLIK